MSKYYNTFCVKSQNEPYNRGRKLVDSNLTENFILDLFREQDSIHTLRSSSKESSFQFHPPEQRPEQETQRVRSEQKETNTSKIIFISHRSTDKPIADMLVGFLLGTGFPKESVFCSSLPGNDINEQISKEVKSALKHSIVNIAILSQDYYQSAYCLNEAGILWYEDTPLIPIALPEINPSNMYGFLNSEYKLRRLDSDTDIAYIYDIANGAISKPNTKASIITYENKKLREMYGTYIKTRKTLKESSIVEGTFSIEELTTDDERIVLYYILQKNVRKVSKLDVLRWLNEHEIHDVNVDNAFDLLSTFEGSIVNNDILEFGIKAFRKYSTEKGKIRPDLERFVNKHTRLAADEFKKLWTSNTIDSNTKLFIAYIEDEKIHSFGDRWMAEGQIESIRQWESKNALFSTLSTNYGRCLEFLIQHELVYTSSWTKYDNPREYALYPSLQKFLFDCPSKIVEELQEIKNSYLDIPF